jgi:hypothetical protein
MKRYILLLVAFVLKASVFAFDFSVNGIFYKIKENNTKVAVTLASQTGNSYSGDVIIPSTVTHNSKTYSVTQIYPFAFSSCHSVTSIVIPNSVDSIEEGAFWGCINLASLNIPASVKKIGSYSFVGDTILTSITVDAANPYYKSSLGVLYNKNLNNLLSYPAGKPALSYTIPNTVDSIGDLAFSYCKFTSVTIPNTVKYMAHGTFTMCNGLTSVYIPASVRFLRNNPFYDCKNMTSVTVDPANLENQSVDGVIFKKELGQPLQTIIYYPPAKVGSSYVIPNTVTYVRSSTFLNCLNLTSITIPASVTKIRSGMLQGCKNLTSINVYSTQPIDLTSIVPGDNSDKVFEGVDTLHCVLHVPVGSRALYAAAFQWKGFSNIVEGYASGFSSTNASKLKINIHNQQINVSGYSIGEFISLYDMQGKTIYHQKANSLSTTIMLNKNGVFMVKVGAEQVKVFM